MEYTVNINGIDVKAQFSEKSITEIFIPLLENLSHIHDLKKRRILVMLAAPPGAGKSTLVSFLETLAKEVIPGKKVQAIGMDGFHRRQEYLLSHTVSVNGQEIRMVEIKGAPATFDLEKLTDKVKEVTMAQSCLWPVYDRLLHNPIEDVITVDGDIVLLEGNYLLLDMDGWRELSGYADYTIAVQAETEFLRARLTARKEASGNTREKAVQFVDFSDMANVRLCLEKTRKADLELVINPETEEFEYKE
ncbi:MAG: nucleoside/nucleotide kinase family protein [Solobacterium sp.]|nr:nucleoside/nucleotide kinase family protein [Solobacterium sp.]